VYSGPVRIVVRQSGNEFLWNTAIQTNEGFMTKTYTFYDGLQWLRIDTNLTNIAGYSITRNSTDFGALLFDAARAFGSNWQSAFGNTTQPGWWFAADQFSSFHAGIIHIYSNSTSNYWVANASGQSRMGIRLNETTIPTNGWIAERAAMHFNDTTGDFTQVRALRDSLDRQPVVTQNLPEEQYVNVTPVFNASVFNRNEVVLIIGNYSGLNDIYNLTKKANATLDMGTPSPTDDQTIMLSDDGTGNDLVAGDRLFTGVFQIGGSASVGTWNVTFRSYTQGNEFLNATNGSFNVTSTYNVIVNITNDRPVVSTQVNGTFTVKTYRNDFFIPGASPACRIVGGSDISNVASLGNGTYVFNFTAPPSTGLYTVNCNATLDGNFGEAEDFFTVEVGTTNITIVPTPVTPNVPGVTLASSGSFVLSGNATNVGNGTAYSLNISLEILSGWSANITSSQCGDILTSGFCVRGFNVSVPAGTSPGLYIINMTTQWKNPDGTNHANKTEVNVSVLSSPNIEVYENNVTGEVGDGIWGMVGNFTVISSGNDNINNITYSCAFGTVCSSFNVFFNPVNISSIIVGANSSVSINVSVPIATAPGTYNGTVNVSAQNDGFDTFILFVSVPQKTNVTIEAVPSTYTASTVTQTTGENFDVYGNATNVLKGSARFMNISLTLPAGWSSNSSIQTCGDLVSGQYCVRGFGVNIPSGTPPTYYNVTVQANWTNPDGTMSRNFTVVNVSVVSNPAINVTQTTIGNNVSDGRNSSLGEFTVASVGNGALNNISFNCIYGNVCSNFILNFNPTSIETLAAGTNQTVKVNVTVPSGYYAGLYNGTVNVTTSNDGHDSFVIQVNVSENRTWSLSPVLCQVSLIVSEGKACDINITNYGNTLINFTVSPSSGNFTTPNTTNFSLNGTRWSVVRIDYNTTGQAPGIYNTSFIFDASQPDSSPSLITVNVTLIPFTPPTINVTKSATFDDQNSTITFNVNVTDLSGTGISFARINVTRPGGVLDVLNMTLVNTSGNLTIWTVSYPSVTTGNTTERGNYSFVVYSGDNLGNVGNITGSFIIFSNVSVTLSTLAGTYYQGNQGSIFYISRNFTKHLLPNVTVNFTIRDPSGNITHTSSNFQTNMDGSISPLPTFQIPSDAMVGNYILTSMSSYYDDVVNRTVEFQKNHTFSVQAQTVSVSGLFADLETTVVWYPNNIMKFGILVYNGEGQPVDATSMNLTIFDPAGSVYKMANLSDMSHPSTGYYTYQFSMPAGTPNGMYLAVLEAHQNNFETLKLKAFRVTQGGPYDLRLFLSENEVMAGTNLDFTVNVENKGEVSQDVFIEYWISPIGSNSTISLFSEAVLTPGLSNQTFARNIFIPTATQQGSYLINARMTYSSVEPQIVVNKSFIVVGAAPTSGAPPTTGSTAGGGSTGTTVTRTVTEAPEPGIPAQILISRYNNNITLARGFTKIESVVVTNIGKVTLNNISLYLLGVTPDWFVISPSVYKDLAPGNSSIFIMTFELPKNAAVGEYPANLLATSGVVSDQKRITVSVLSSIYELIKADIKKLREDLQELQVEMRVGQIQGKDVTAIEIILDQIKSQIDEAEELLNLGKHQESLDKIRGAKNLVDKARDLLDKLNVQLPEFRLPWEIILPVTGTVGAVGIFIFLLWRKKRLPKGIRPWMLQLGRMAEGIIQTKPQTKKEDLFGEKDRLLRMLEVLEKERDERIISLGAYNEMRKSIERKLAALDKK
jgi:uncharacterized membrane protein